MVLSADAANQDIIAVTKQRGAAIQMLYVRGGKLIGQRQFILDGAGDSNPSEAVQEFVKQYYTDAPEVPREVLLPVEIEERNIVQTWLRQRKGSLLQSRFWGRDNIHPNAVGQHVMADVLLGPIEKAIQLHELATEPSTEPATVPSTEAATVLED